MTVCKYYLRYDYLTGKPVSALGHRKPAVIRMRLAMLMQKHANKKTVHMICVTEKLYKIKFHFKIRNTGLVMHTFNTL
jgi:hypothetical protein